MERTIGLKVEDTLPDRLSDLLEVAVNDAKACGKDPRYKLSMMNWHEPIGDSGVCRVCLAGSVIAKTLKEDATHFTDPLSYRQTEKDRPLDGLGPVARKLLALNAMREGSGPHTYMNCKDHDFKGILEALLPIRRSFSDRDGGRATWAAYEEAIANLRAIGY